MDYPDAELAAARAEITRLRREGTPGVMHKIDKAFLDLAIRERDYARTQVRNRDNVIADLEAALAGRDAEIARLREIEWMYQELSK